MSKVKIVNAHLFELNPDSKYIVALSKREFSEDDGHKLLDQLKAMGINNAVGLFLDDPSKDLKIIEQKES